MIKVNGLSDSVVRFVLSSCFTALCYPISECVSDYFKKKKITSSDLIRKEKMLSQCLEHKLKEGQVLYSLVTFQLSQIIRPGMLSKVTGGIQSFKGNPTFPAFGAATWSWMMKIYVTLALFFFVLTLLLHLSTNQYFSAVTEPLLLHHYNTAAPSREGELQHQEDIYTHHCTGSTTTCRTAGCSDWGSVVVVVVVVEGLLLLREGLVLRPH